MKGLNRLVNAGQDETFDIRNARIEPYGEVRGYRGGELLSSNFPDGEKPWFRVNGRWITATDGVSCGDGYLNRFYYSSYDNDLFEIEDNDSNVISAPAYITSASLVSGYAEDAEEFDLNGDGTSPEDLTGITVNKAVDYVLIPFNKNNEAGPWIHGTFVVDVETITSGSIATVIPKFSLSCAPHTAYVDVYRSTEYSIAKNRIRERYKGRRRFWIVGDRLDRTRQITTAVQGTDGLYYAGRVNLNGTLSEFNVSNVLERTGSYDMVDHWPFEVFNDEQGVSGQVGPVMDRNMNVWGIIRTNKMPVGAVRTAYELKYGVGNTFMVRPAAKVMYNHAGVMMHGNASIPTKQPQITNRWTTDSAPNEIWAAGTGGKLVAVPPTRSDTSTREVLFQYEYQTDEGVRYGPPIIGTAAYAFSVAWQGEQALLVFVKDPDYATVDHANEGVWRMFERIEPDHNGNYITRYQFKRNLTRYKFNIGNPSLVFDGEGPTAESPIDTLQAAFDSYIITDIYDSSDTTQGNALIRNKAAGPFPVTENIKLKNYVFMSDQNRPYEFTYSNYVVPNSKEVRAIAGARLAEAEGLKAYEFYVMSESHVFVTNRRDDIITMDYVLNGVGVALSEQGNALYAPVRDGVVMAGTDGKMYFLSGRAFIQLDYPVEKLWNAVTDMTYNEDRNRLEILTNTGIWVYDFDQKGWIGQRQSTEDIEVTGVRLTSTKVTFLEELATSSTQFTASQAVGANYTVTGDFKLEMPIAQTLQIGGADFSTRQFSVEVFVDRTANGGPAATVLLTGAHLTYNPGVFKWTGPATVGPITLEEDDVLKCRVSSDSASPPDESISLSFSIWEYNLASVINLLDEVTENIGYFRDRVASVIRYESDNCVLWTETGAPMPNTMVKTQPVLTAGTHLVPGIKVDYDGVTVAGLITAGTTGSVTLTSGTLDDLDVKRAYALVTLANGEFAFRTVLLNTAGSVITFTEDLPSVPLVGSQVKLYRQATATVSVRTLANRTYEQEFVIPAMRTRYPKLKGRDTQIAIKNFEVLREILILNNVTLETD